MDIGVDFIECGVKLPPPPGPNDPLLVTEAFGAITTNKCEEALCDALELLCSWRFWEDGGLELVCFLSCRHTCSLLCMLENCIGYIKDGKRLPSFTLDTAFVPSIFTAGI